MKKTNKDESAIAADKDQLLLKSSLILDRVMNTNLCS